MVYYYFTAEWCGPCKTIKPMVIASGKATIVDVDSGNGLVAAHNIKSVPTVIGIEGGVVKERYSGTGEIQKWLNK